MLGRKEVKNYGTTSHEELFHKRERVFVKEAIYTIFSGVPQG